MWELFICVGISWMGCGMNHVHQYPTETACYKALALLRTNDYASAESNERRGMTAICRPKQ